MSIPIKKLMKPPRKRHPKVLQQAEIDTRIVDAFEQEVRAQEVFKCDVFKFGILQWIASVNPKRYEALMKELESD